MARLDFFKRRGATLASATALVTLASTVAVIAFNADGYQRHDAELNDGGIWVTNGAAGSFGRANKPIGQLDGVISEDQGDLDLEVVQDGAAVVTFERGTMAARSIDPARLAFADGGVAALPVDADIQLLGGTLASIDRASGELWGARVDVEVGRPLVSAVDSSAPSLSTIGADAALAVSTVGTIHALSASKDVWVTVRPSGTGLGEAVREKLPASAGEPDAMTAVGDTAVALDTAAGTLSVKGGPGAEVPPGSLLQQPGPSAATVLVAAPTALLEVDLTTGDVTEVAPDLLGTPTRPVQVGACSFGAWGVGPGTLVSRCGDAEVLTNDLGESSTGLLFRVNRGEVVLNDAIKGTVWDIDSETPRTIDNWFAFSPRNEEKESKSQEETTTRGDRRPPKAEPDSYGVRPGRTSVLHPLDNDSAPKGRLLSIVGVDQPGGDARVSISPDGQTLQFVAPTDVSPSTFSYYVDDGRDISATASVSILPRGTAQNAPPRPREGYEPRKWSVPLDGTLAVPILGDWRDDADSDALVLESARVVGGGAGASARSTSDGRLRFTAPPERSGPVTVEYTVSDGSPEAATGRMRFDVTSKDDRTRRAPVAEPDVTSGEVNKPIRIRPLANDLPGADPSSPLAQLALAGDVAEQPGLQVSTDLAGGTLTVKADKPGTFFLDYEVLWGRAPSGRGKIRVDARPAPQRAEAPVAMPDTTTLFGQAPALVDVLVNDVDPAGGLLVVQSAQVVGGRGQAQVAVVDGRWLRIQVPAGSLNPNPQLVRYSVSNGRQSAVGEVTVGHREEPEDNSPVTVTDKVTVRAGGSVSSPVLDNDTAPSGDRLALASPDAESGGELEIVAQHDFVGDTGRAFISGRTVRYVAPTRITEPDTFEVPYVALTSTGDSAGGVLEVTVVPTDRPNNAPVPPTVEGRAVANDVITLRIPGAGVDPDGDPVTFTAVTSAPSLGRVVSQTATTLEYQAFPGGRGTDEFSYSVTDTRGAVGTGSVRVAVVPADGRQAPVAVDDDLVVEPGRNAHFDPLANDYVAPGAQPRLTLVDPPEGVVHDEETGLVTVPSSADPEAPSVTVVYRITDGVNTSGATMTLRTAEGARNAPIVYDSHGDSADADAAVAEVLAGAHDPDGDAGDLEVVEVFGDPELVSHDERTIRVVRGPEPRVVPFVVSDADGTLATASLYVPATGVGLPRVRRDALVTMGADGERVVDLDDLVVNPSGGDVSLVGAKPVAASPTQVSASIADGKITVRSGQGYRGPAALLIAVAPGSAETAGASNRGASDGAVVLSVPVQVGDDKPVLSCPTTVVPLSAGQLLELDLASVCTVATLDPRDVDSLSWSASWAESNPEVTLGEAEGSWVDLTVDDAADSGGDVALEIRAGESNTEVLRFQLDTVPSPRVLAIPRQEVGSGERLDLDLSDYVVSALSDPTVRVLSVERVGGAAVPVSNSGSRVSFSPSRSTTGRASFAVVLTDVAGDPPASRQVRARVDVDVLGVPDVPVGIVIFREEDTGKIEVRWNPVREDGGSPILYYEIREKAGAMQRCRTNKCYHRGAKRGKSYSFQVRAVNRVGASGWSDFSKESVVATRPARVSNIRLASRGDGTIKIAWRKPPAEGSPILGYEVNWQGGTQTLGAGQTSATIPGLDNNRTYRFAVAARNSVGMATPRESDPFQSLGTPKAPTGIQASDLESGAQSTTVRVQWNATAAEGPGPTRYTVYVSRAGGAARTVAGCVRVAAVNCLDTGVAYDGATLRYRVRAHNQPSPEEPRTSPASSDAEFLAIGRPAEWGDWSWRATGQNQQVELSYTVPESRGRVSNVDVMIGTTSLRTFEGQRGAATVRVPLDSNSQPWRVTLRVCNENRVSGCRLSGEQLVQSYGPLAGGIREVVPSVDGLSMTWNVVVDPNGDDATLAWDLPGQGTQSRVVAGPAAQTVTITYRASDWSTDVPLRLRLFDPSPARGEVSYESVTKSGDPPQPTARVSVGAECSTPAAGGLPACGANPTPPCMFANCANIRVEIDAFVEPYSCVIRGTGWGTVVEFSEGPGPLDAIRGYYGGVGPNAGITMECSSARQNVTTSVAWPGD